MLIEKIFSYIQKKKYNYIPRVICLSESTESPFLARMVIYIKVYTCALKLYYTLQVSLKNV